MSADDLTALEEQHGFTFGGDHTTDGAPATLALVCTNLRCPNRGQHVQLHADSVLPATCGGCGGVLHCDHTDTTTAEHHEGTLREPRRIVRTVCTACGIELHRDERSLAPIAVEDIPLHLLGGVNLDAIAREQQ